MSDYRPNQQGWREIANSPQLHAALLEVAEKAKVYAEGLAEEFRRTGEYAESFHATSETVLWDRGPRAAARLANTSDHAAAVEWGNRGDEHPHRTLGRTLDALKAL